MRKILFRIALILAFVSANHVLDGGPFDILTKIGPFGGQLRAQQQSSYVAGERVAQQYAYGYGNISGASVAIGNTATGTQTLTVCPAFRTTADGRQIQIFSTAPATPVAFDVGFATAETVTPTSVSILAPGAISGVGADQSCATITGTFNQLHGASQFTSQVRSGTFGLQEAINDAGQVGGSVTVDNTWGGTNTILNAAVVLPNVAVVDKRFGVPQFWNPAPNTTAFTAPTAPSAAAACTATVIFCSDATVAGSASWGGTVFGCYTYVDIMGNESVCSTTASFTSVASKAIDMGPPPAATGAVGWKPYLSLSGGTYALAYSVPLLTQPTVLQAVPVSAGVCQLTQLETVTPACALVNTTYGQASSTTGNVGLFAKGGMQFTGYPVVTNTLAPNLDSASAQSLNPNTNGHTVYTYVPGSHTGIPQITSASQTFPITTAAQSTIGQVAGSIALPPNFMNYVGRNIRVCGMLSKTSTNASTITNIQLWWDAEGSNVTTGQPIQLSNLILTQTQTAAQTISFCQDLRTTVAAATATGGTILPGNGWFTTTQVAAGTLFAGVANSLFAAVGSLNLALNAHIDVVYNHTTGTDGAGVLLTDATVQILN